MSAPRTARARVRAELTREIADAARRQLAESGAAGLSLRAVARELGMASSAVYRYFANRDELLTALIASAYDGIGAAAEAADAAVARGDHLGRWRAVGEAVRDWAQARPHEYALVYGSPVPGYAAPDSTVGPASRVVLALGANFADAARGGRLAPLAVPVSEPSGPLAAELAALLAGVPGGAEGVGAAAPDVVRRCLAAWTQLFGTVSFELFGQYAMVGHREEYVRHTLELTGVLLGLRAE
ncbi:TetR/AcrR family transcriptional regulator [Allonocardiopsis opalescens]|uniref:TetR family transcriptional regulator n=1 Tax=Allonocardiopsis opalescens TaxID=1144618 RepID=A0A2T0Q4I8_9ACTN|nr:TetR/AcrR family transcriptional regulator [Allonocardiopsis opalescens]PRX98700.1 TetR family transcriptional regulator [Allonocardiopsis opalescens]